jgi:hypothetical protein
MGVALGLAELGVAEYLLDDTDADSVIEQQGPDSVPVIVHSGIPEVGCTDE